MMVETHLDPNTEVHIGLWIVANSFLCEVCFTHQYLQNELPHDPI